MADGVTLLNTILANGSVEYVARVPLATRTNIADVGAPILEYNHLQNEFLNALVNKIAFQVIRSKIAQNPLSVLKRGTVPLGVDIEDIHTNLASGSTYDPTGADLLNRSIPDTKTVYHRMNRQDMYKVTVGRAQLKTAFTSFAKLDELITGIINTLYSGDNFDEFILMKNLIADGYTNDEIVFQEVTPVTDEATAKSLVKVMRNSRKYFQFPSSNFNKFADAQLALDPLWTGTPVITWTPPEDQIIIIRADIATNMDVDVLAQAFNMEKASLLGQMLEVDTFGSADNVYAGLFDKSFFQVYDTHQEMTSFYNPEGLYWNYFWHHWQVYSYSMFANAVLFGTAPVVG